MALTDPEDTLAHHQSRTLTSHRDMSEMPLSAVTAKAAAFFQTDTAKDTKPECDALWFYGLNHGMALIAAERDPLEPLSEAELAFVRQYHTVLGPKAVRAFYYLLMICTREARHNQSLSKDAPKIAQLFGLPVANFFQGIEGGEPSIHAALLKSPPAVTVGAYCSSLSWVFYNSKWHSGYGGKKWGNVADCLLRFVKGEYSAEMMLDTVWTLSHNGGPIFNKGLCYAMYTAPALIRILDVQRSGQIPQAVTDDNTVRSFAPPVLIQQMQLLQQRYPDKIGSYVDWQMVEALGAVMKYPKEIAAQEAKYGLSEAAKKAKADAALKAKALAEAQAKAAAEHAKNWFQVMPGVEVKIIHRKAA